MVYKKLTIISICIITLLAIFLSIIIPRYDDIKYYFNNEIGLRHYEFDEHGRPIGLPLVDYYPTEQILVKYNGAHVKFIEKKHHFDETKRTEYVFEIVEWLNVSEDIDTTQKRISVFSEAYPLKWKSYTELYEANYDMEYEEGEEYIIVVMKKQHDDGEYLKIVHNYYINLSDLKKGASKENVSYYLFLKDITAEMSADEIVAKIKELIAEEKAKAEA
jgi:hypothetical protein